MNETTNHPDGIVTISDNAVMQIASYAAKSCPGVAGMSDKSRAVDAVRIVSGKNGASGVYVTNTKSGVKLDVYIACTYGSDTKLLSSDVAETVKSAFPGTGIKIKEVIVHINDVR